MKSFLRRACSTIYIDIKLHNMYPLQKLSTQQAEVFQALSVLRRKKRETLRRPSTELSLALDCSETDMREKDEYCELQNTFQQTDERTIVILDLLTEPKIDHVHQLLSVAGLQNPNGERWRINSLKRNDSGFLDQLVD